MRALASASRLMTSSGIGTVLLTGTGWPRQIGDEARPPYPSPTPVRIVAAGMGPLTTGQSWVSCQIIASVPSLGDAPDRGPALHPCWDRGRVHLARHSIP